MGQNCGSTEELVVIGKIGSPFGVKGWLRVNSFTDPQSNIWDFDSWFLLKNDQLNHFSNNNLINSAKHVSNLNGLNANDNIYRLSRLKESRNKFLVLFQDIIDRTQASKLTNKSIAIKRSDLPKLTTDQYYWVDLIGAKVYNLSNFLLGCLDHVFATAAHDIMVIKNIENNKNIEYLIPYSLSDTVVKIDLENRIIIVNWKVD